MTDRTLIDFIRESNAIEGIFREPTDKEIKAHQTLLNKKGCIEVSDLKKFVKAIQPNAVLRNKIGLNVRVGNYIAPLGEPDILKHLEELLDEMPFRCAYTTHIEYESLHPFTDGNGRSGRALWLWQTGNNIRPFLQTFYYNTLENFHG
jgi:Fic family protein